MASAASSQIVQKLWNYCSVLRDDGLSYQGFADMGVPCPYSGHT